MKRKASKREYLKLARAWNERARSVDSSLFKQSDFFDSRDKVQVKYEMLRAAFVDGLPVSEASKQFGYSRESFYTTAESFRDMGIVGLTDGKRGPKQPRKLIAEVQRLITEQMIKAPEMSGREIAKHVAEQTGIEIHHRSVERFISNRRKKNNRFKRVSRKKRR